MLHGSVYKRFMIITVLFIFAYGKLCWAESSPDTKVLLSSAQDHVEVTIIGMPYGPSTRHNIRELIIQINDKKKNEIKEFIYRDYIRRLRNIEFCSAGKVLIFGEVFFTGSSSGGDNILVLDMENGVIQDSIRAYRYALSPSKEFLVYRSWHPRLSMPIARRSICMLYDIRKSQSENRDRYVKKYSYENAGFPIFPEVNVFFQPSDPNAIHKQYYRGRYNNLIGDEYNNISKYLWSNDSNRIVFFVKNVNEKDYYLIHVVLDDVTLPEIYRSKVTFEDFTNWDVIKDADVEKLREDPYKLKLYLKDFDWYNNNHIIVNTSNRAYWAEKEFIMKVPSE